MIILAIDTCENHCSAALIDTDLEAKVLAHQSEQIGRGHAERLLPLIDELFMSTPDVSYGDISRVAVTTGPGTFTGLRIGLSAARGIALTVNVPCVGLTSLQILALQAKALGHVGLVHAMIMGRGGQAFYQMFEILSDTMLPMAQAEPSSRHADDIVQTIRDRGGLAVGSGAQLFTDNHKDIDIKVVPLNVRILGLAAAVINPKDYPADPTYFRPPDAVASKPLLPTAPIVDE